MVCPFCLHEKTEIYNSRAGTRLNTTWRRRRCKECCAQFTTYERADAGSLLTVKGEKEIKQFSSTRLLLELLRVCDHRRDLDEVVPYLAATIEQKLYRHMALSKDASITSQVIFLTISETLQHYDAIAYVKYIGLHQKHVDAPSIRRALKRKK